MIQIIQHESLLKQLGLDTMEGVKNYNGKIVERSPGRRDVTKIEAPQSGFPLTLFLKRHWKVSRIKSLLTFPRHLRIESLACREWSNAKRLQQAHFRTAPLVAFGEEIGPLGERFSFIITEQAPGTCSLEEFFANCSQPSMRRLVFDSLASEVRRLHSRGLSLPDLFARHVFFNPESACVSFCFIDVARLDAGSPLSSAQRARCLAALNVSASGRLVTLSERVRFYRRYAVVTERNFFYLILKRTKRLLRRRRYQKLHSPDSNSSTAPSSNLTQARHL